MQAPNVEVKPTIECSRVRACKWQGQPEELTKVKNDKESKEYGFDIFDNVCPKCGCKTYYDISQK